MSFFGNLFGKKKTPQEQLREHKRTLDRAVREIDRGTWGRLRRVSIRDHAGRRGRGDV